MGAAELPAATRALDAAVALWRRLKKLGVAQVCDGLVALPADARTREQLEWLAEQVLESGGAAGVWLARPGTLAQERELASGMAAARASEYIGLAETAEAVASGMPSELGRSVAQLRRQWREVTGRDFFLPPEREVAAAALRALVDASAPQADVRGAEVPG